MTSGRWLVDNRDMTQILDQTMAWFGNFLASGTILSGATLAAIIMSMLWFVGLFTMELWKGRQPPVTHIVCGKTFVQGRKETVKEFHKRMDRHYWTCV